MRKPIIAGNWKMFKTIAEADSFVQHLPVVEQEVDVVVCAPFTALFSLTEPLRAKNIALGAQNVHWESEGAFTGEVSPGMLAEIGVKYVIIGHSERRAYFNETDETVNRKVRSALDARLMPIVCVGENLSVREAGQTSTIVNGQITAALSELSAEQLNQIVIAYEPIWAIGTGQTATAEEANEVIKAIRGCIAEQFGSQWAEQVRIQYGGSVNPQNIQGFMSQSDIDGALVGGASLTPDSFIALVKGAAE
ncbi:triose-phosphate isomerase [Ammoniphilus oxalaticus]|uniref:Triosephosphate isomerase n=1 Tax=Ammoniphilus oxalaticus TaxID=66863 RepID=A0A419SEN7_9BACL|nr:triose-phosphate isomerase [Ammoniphilus oxalaticus]RKD21795.1 triose-phosphate isomerase [Ammoniphilus oxalaticus]